MNALVTASEITTARSILQLYDEGVKALTTVVDFAECKFWDNKAEALAAWARIYNDETLLRKAKFLKLQAYAAMGRLANKEADPDRGRRMPRTRQWLKSHGMSNHQAGAALELSRLSSQQMTEIEKRRTIPTPNSFNSRLRRELSTRVAHLCGVSVTSLEEFDSVGDADLPYVINRLSKLRDGLNEVLDRLAYRLEKSA